MLRWRVGDATVIRIPELDATAALAGLIPRLDLAGITGDAWLRPNFVDEAGRPRGLVQAFVILIAGYTIMVDPGVGNGKRRFAVPGWDDLQTDFLCRLSRPQAWHRVTSITSSIRICILIMLGGTQSWWMGPGGPHSPPLVM